MRFFDLLKGAKKGAVDYANTAGVILLDVPTPGNAGKGVFPAVKM